MKVILNLALLLAAAVLGTGCVSVMKKEAFEGPMVAAGDNCNRAHDDLVMKQGIYNEVARKTSTPKAEPYPEMGRLIAKMEAAFKKASGTRGLLFPIEKKFTDIRQGRPDVGSDRPRWDEFMKLFEEMKVIIPRLQGELNEYSAASNQFSALANQHGISQVKVAEIRANLDGNLNQMKTAADGLRAQLRDMDDRLLKSTIQSMGIQQHKERHEIVARLRGYSRQLDQVAEAMKSKSEAFAAATKGMDTLWRGPGFPKIDVVEQMGAEMKKAQGVTGQIHADVERWNAMNK